MRRRTEPALSSTGRPVEATLATLSGWRTEARIILRVKKSRCGHKGQRDERKPGERFHFEKGLLWELREC